uniref:hypothetical protein n=1 Tax=uncultured Aquimarina sp. TaxID=575652 RepID=UPI0026086B81
MDPIVAFFCKDLILFPIHTQLLRMIQYWVIENETTFLKPLLPMIPDGNLELLFVLQSNLKEL